jgi:hypothetical protein
VLYTEEMVRKTDADLDPEPPGPAGQAESAGPIAETVGTTAVSGSPVAEAERRARLVDSAGGPDLGDGNLMAGAWT